MKTRFATVLRCAALWVVLVLPAFTVAQTAGQRPPPPPPGAPPPPHPGHPLPPLGQLPPPPPQVQREALANAYPAPIETSAAPAVASAIDQAQDDLDAARVSGDALAVADAADKLAGDLIAAKRYDDAVRAADESLTAAKSADSVPASQRAALRLAQISSLQGDDMQAGLWRKEAAEFGLSDDGDAGDMRDATEITSASAQASATTEQAAAQPTTITIIQEKVRTPRTLVVLGALALLAWWYSHRRSMRLLSQKRDLERRHRVLRTTNLQLQQAAHELQQIAVEDALTGVLTRKEFVTRLDALLKHAEHYGKPVQLCVFDLDHFKRINDTQGHMTGDAALRVVVGIGREHLRSEDLFGRFGGDEFMIAGMDRDMPAMTALMERIRISVSDKSAHSTGLKGLTLSMGVAEANPVLGYVRDDLFHRADSALYTAKRGGRDRVVQESEADVLSAADTHPLRNLEESTSNA